METANLSRSLASGSERIAIDFPGLLAESPTIQLPAQGQTMCQERIFENWRFCLISNVFADNNFEFRSPFCQKLGSIAKYVGQYGGNSRCSPSRIRLSGNEVEDGGVSWQHQDTVKAGKIQSA
ncbi:MAG TPA: hypothetical protein VLY03_08090 [Bacteroidota bacterium]|nr:hypothetical protein [Bacteroidota bacterium]